MQIRTDLGIRTEVSQTGEGLWCLNQITGAGPQRLDSLLSSDADEQCGLVHAVSQSLNFFPLK